MGTLDKIAKYYNTDKSSENHNYCVKYEKYLPFNRFDKLKILEIGVLYGNSLKTWKDYFYNSKIIGIDIDSNCTNYIEDRIDIEIGSQTDKDFLELISNKYGPFDLIVDDGSHINSDVIFSFENLFSNLKSQGVYVIEDCTTSYWDEYGGGYLKTSGSVEYFKKLSDDINFRGLMNMNYKIVHARREDILIDLSLSVQPDCRVDIESINFLNGIIIITKR
jgi:hypothetical protein